MYTYIYKYTYTYIYIHIGLAREWLEGSELVAHRSDHVRWRVDVIPKPLETKIVRESAVRANRPVPPGGISIRRITRVSIHPRDISPHQDSAGTAPSGTSPPAQPPPPPQIQGTQAHSAPTLLKRPMLIPKRGPRPRVGIEGSEWVAYRSDHVGWRVDVVSEALQAEIAQAGQCHPLILVWEGLEALEIIIIISCLPLRPCALAHRRYFRTAEDQNSSGIRGRADRPVLLPQRRRRRRRCRRRRKLQLFRQRRQSGEERMGSHINIFT